ncbi:MAG: thioesterase [Magnetococcales bacterium]|nr:thioesterase [Magnetococcales bacterium]
MNGSDQVDWCVLMDRPLQLFCFPFAGGNVYSFRSWPQHFSDRIRVEPLELPGRGRRGREPLLVSLEAMIDDMTGQLLSRVQGPYALFGHSLGACLAFGVAHRCVRAGGVLPRHLFLSGRKAPGAIRNEVWKHRLDRPQFLRVLEEYGGFSPQLLADAGFVEYIEPILRADFQAIETHVAVPLPPLPLPLTVFMGQREEFEEAEAQLWRAETSASMTLIQYPGGHFFLNDHLPSVAARIEEDLI